MKSIIWIICFILTASTAGLGQDSAEEKTENFVFDCRTCHICDQPTKKDPCLRACPRAELITIHHSPEEGPVRIVMDEFSGQSDIYEPVIFSHRVHSEMSDMSGGCVLCHHNNPPGHILACRECHETNRSRTDISKPDLMGSYHRQCMDCHRGWSHSTSCTSCHALRSDETKAAVESDLPEPAQRVHPKINVPDKLVYETEYEEGKLVTFYHNEHVQLFGFECGDCHRQESCIRCHDKLKEEQTTETSHNRCSDCHDTDDGCNFCHGDHARSPFSHLKRTNFRTDRYHQDLPCSACHDLKFKRPKPDRACNVCHQLWTHETFDHKVTGLILDENHLEIDCASCHSGQIFDGKPDCSSCHDDDIVYPTNKPGRRAF